MSPAPFPPRQLLVVAHPGHELRVFHWMRRCPTDVFILTDGSGSAGEGRMDQTEEVLRRTHARRAGWLNPLTDKDVYRLILNGDARPFIDKTRELAEYIISHDVKTMAGDMIEGYNPSHDLCRNMINAATELASREGHAVLRNLAFPLVGKPAVERKLQPAEILKLDPVALHEKHEIAMGYGVLRHEVEAALRIAGKDAFAFEILYDAAPLGDSPPDIPPYYEQYGEKRVAAGQYQNVIRFREHVAPLVVKLRSALGLPS